MDVGKSRRWLCGATRSVRTLVVAGSLVAGAPLCGCGPVRYNSDKPPERQNDTDIPPPAQDEGDTDIPPPANAATCICTPVAPFDYDGPSIVGRADELLDLECPEDASLPGFTGIVLPTGTWVRECRITPLPTCGSGWVCAPPPPDGFALCIYRDKESGCPDDYENASTVLETGTSALSNAPATLCCAASHDPP